MKKIMSFVMMLCVLNVLMAGGLIAFLFASGRLNGDKARTIVDLVRHQGAPPKLREQVYDILEPSTATASGPSSQNATMPGGSGDALNEKLGGSADERITFARQAMEQERISLESQAQELRHRQELLVTLQADVQDKLAKIAAAKKESEPKAATVESKAREENFQKTLALYDELKPKQIKDLFVDGKDADLTASYLGAMEASRAGKIIGEFKTDDEKKFLAAVLERIRNAGTSAASGTGTAREIATAAAGTVAPPPPAP